MEFQNIVRRYYCGKLLESFNVKIFKIYEYEQFALPVTRPLMLLQGREWQGRYARIPESHMIMPPGSAMMGGHVLPQIGKLGIGNQPSVQSINTHRMLP